MMSDEQHRLVGAVRSGLPHAGRTTRDARRWACHRVACHVLRESTSWIETELDLFYRSALASFASLNSANETRSLPPHIGRSLRRDPTTAAGPDYQEQQRGAHNSDLIEGERAAEALARDFLDSARDLISLKDTEGRYLFVNRQFEKAVQVRHEEIRGRRTKNHFRRNRPPRFELTACGCSTQVWQSNSKRRPFRTTVPIHPSCRNSVV
jgi:PAS domain-containing protein